MIPWREGVAPCNLLNKTDTANRVPAAAYGTKEQSEQCFLYIYFYSYYIFIIFIVPIVPKGV